MSGAGFKDHFSGIADAYAQARPEYPDALFDAIAAAAPETAHVWEPGCGSGQATRGLAARFAHVHATEPSAKQLAQHWAQPGTERVSLAVLRAIRASRPKPRYPLHPMWHLAAWLPTRWRDRLLAGRGALPRRSSL